MAHGELTDFIWTAHWEMSEQMRKSADYQVIVPFLGFNLSSYKWKSGIDHRVFSVERFITKNSVISVLRFGINGRGTVPSRSTISQWVSKWR